MGRGLERAQAKAAFNTKRQERDNAMAAGDEVTAWRRHEESNKIVKDFRRSR